MALQDLSFPRSLTIAGSLPKPLVLVVDDDEDNLLLLEYCLELFNCRFVGNSDGKNLVALVQTLQPDLILLDIVLPQQSGIELMHQLRESSLTRSIPVVAVTALARLEDRLRLLAEGFDDYLSKPFLLDDLQSTVERYCCQPMRR
ncbi:response regulator [Leptolyngbya ohadii]|uniref:response regulator n=1 Tax=Leptolyngbya ohadii TaxID=1962290 RepID=UPI000B5A0B10|nr:response regulator [Leptolyngbya ohadii]